MWRYTSHLLYWYIDSRKRCCWNDSTSCQQYSEQDERGFFWQPSTQYCRGEKLGTETWCGTQLVTGTTQSDAVGIIPSGMSHKWSRFISPPFCHSRNSGKALSVSFFTTGDGALSLNIAPRWPFLHPHFRINEVEYFAILHSYWLGECHGQSMERSEQEKIQQNL